MIFLVIFQKISEKKSASIFSKVGSKESQWNTDEKVGLRQDDILKFEWSNLSKRYFLTSFLKKYLEKIEKMRKFRKKNLDDWVRSTLNYHPVSISSMFNASKAFI